MKSKLAALKNWIDTKYYKQNGQVVWDLYLQLIRYWGCMSKEERNFMESIKKVLLNK